jgi:hypothetical protein
MSSRSGRRAIERRSHRCRTGRVMDS